MLRRVYVTICFRITKVCVNLFTLSNLAPHTEDTAATYIFVSKGGGVYN